MKLKNRLEQDFKTALRVKDRITVDALRLLLAAVKNREIEKKAELDDNDIIQLFRGEAKKRREALAIYRQAGRNELAEKEANELEIISRFLPEELDEAGVKQTVEELKQAGQLPENFGEAMKLVMGRLKGQADGRMVAQVVKMLL